MKSSTSISFGPTAVLLSSGRCPLMWAVPHTSNNTIYALRIKEQYHIASTIYFLNRLSTRIEVISWRVCTKALPSLLSLLSRCVHVSLHVRVCATTVWSRWPLRTRAYFAQNGKHTVSHVGWDVIDGAGAIGTHRARHLMKKVPVSHCTSPVLGVTSMRTCLVCQLLGIRRSCNPILESLEKAIRH